LADFVAATILFNFPVFPQVNFTPTMLGWAESWMMTSEDRSMPDTAPGKLYITRGIGDWSATVWKNSMTLAADGEKRGA
jgi:hypothetical protein